MQLVISLYCSMKLTIEQPHMTPRVKVILMPSQINEKDTIGWPSPRNFNSPGLSSGSVKVMDTYEITTFTLILSEEHAKNFEVGKEYQIPITQIEKI